MTDTLLDVAQQVLDTARRHGAEAADIAVVGGTGMEIEIRGGILEKLEQDEGMGLSLRVFVGQSQAMTSGNVTTPDALARLAENAVNMARLAPPDPFAGLAPSDLLARAWPDLDLSASEMPGAGALKAMALAAEGAALAVSGVSKSGGVWASSSRRHVAFAASNGFSASYNRSAMSLSVSAIAGEGTHMERDHDHCSVIHPEDMVSPEALGRKAGGRAVRRLAPRKIASRPAPVIFDRRVAASLIGHFAAAINGAAIARGTSFLKNEMGREVFSKCITILDDPLRTRGLGSRAFDGEGLAVQQRAFIDRGRLTGWLLDLRSARQLGLTPSGNAGRGGGAPPSPSPSNFYLEAGTLTPQDLYRDMGEGFLVTEMMGSSINMVTGDYSRGASGFWIEKGEIAYPVSGITIAGQLKDMFRRMTPANDLEFKSSINAPSCLVEGMTIAGR